MDWLNSQVKNVTNTVSGPSVDPNTGMQMNGQQEEKKPWWKFGFGGAKKPKPKTKTKKTKKPKKQTKYKRN